MALAKEENLAKLITNFSANSKKTAQTKRTVGYLSARKELLLEYWKRYNIVRDEIAAMKPAEKDEAAVAAALDDDKFSTIEAAYCEALGELSDFISEATPIVTTVSDNSALNNTVHSQQSALILPKIELPKFDGTCQKWLSFKDMFTTCVINEPSLSNVQRMHYLKCSLQGDAEAILRNLSVIENNFQIAWDMLVQRYDSKRRLVKAYLRDLVNLPILTSESAIAMRKLLDKANESVRGLTQLQCATDQWDDWLVFLITEKLDSATVKDWEISLDNPNVLPEFKKLVTFLENRIQGLEATTISTKFKQKELHGKPPSTRAIRSHQTNLSSCAQCAGKHALPYCSNFRALTAPQKLDLVSKVKLCTNCLKSNHNLNECTSTYTCFKCKQKHHTLLHDSLISCNSVSTNHVRTNYGRTNHVRTNYVRTNHVRANHVRTNHGRANCTNQSQIIRDQIAPITTVLLATAIIGVRSETGYYLKLRTLLDSGSQASFISECAAQQLHLRRTRVQVPVTGIGGAKVGKATGMVTFNICSLTEPNYRIQCTAFVLPRLGHLMPRSSIDSKSYDEFLSLPLADPNFYEPGSIDIIVGADLYGLFLRGEIKRSYNGTTIAQNTHVGWVISGSIPNSSTLQLPTNFCATAITELNDLVQQMWKFNNIDDIQPPSKMTEDERYCEDFFERTVQRKNSGRYQVRYPFKEGCDLSALAGSKADAFQLYAHQQRRLKNNPTLNHLYENFMTEYLELGHMEPVIDNQDSQPVCYIPHHGVYKESSSTTKLRTVFNASRKYNKGISLNDCIHVGPKLQNDLCSILINWRTHKVGFIADIEKCYRQILVDSTDTDLQRIVWRDENDKPATYRLLTVTYGLNCSPYLTIKVLHTLAADEKKDFPTASKILQESFYMDDCLHGADSVEEAVQLQQELQALLQCGGFTLRKWNSNSTEFMQYLNADASLRENCCDLNLDRETKALGIYWFCDSDSIGYKVSMTPLTSPITKRQQLSDVAKIYDPPGLLAPIVITGKSFCQQLWLLGCDWDDPLPQHLQQEWQKFREELVQIQTLKIPRWVGTSPTAHSIQLHVFADASKSAYAAVAYLRVETLDSEVKISILMARTKVAPLKKITIPCLELNGALLAAKVTAKVLSTVNLPNIQTFCWSDSKTALSWIRSNPGQHKQYISNRVAQIQNLTNIDSWKYVPTATNPADVASRGILPSQLAELSIWWEGPPWLYFQQDDWPEQKNATTVNTPQSISSLLTAAAPSEASLVTDLLQKFSNINKLLAVTSWCNRFIAVLLKKPHETASWCTASERATALKFWIRYVQQNNFSNEISCLRQKKLLNTKSKLLKLNPMVDDEGILRLNGRLKNSTLPAFERFPIILPKNNQLSNLLIAQGHELTMHGGVQATRNLLGRRYHIIDARSTIKKHIHRCVRCFRQKCSPSTQIMGNLPAQRCTPSKAFSHCGLDYGGPFHIRTTKGRGHQSYKGYVALFTCFSTRAIHLELVSDMTTDTFLAALRRFFAQRGYSSDIYSDCATTFVGANAVLKEDFAAYKQQLEAAAKYVACHGVSWHFIPPGSPNFGGIWEAGIKSMKHHLKRTIGEAKLTFEEFYTVLKQVEMVLNSRPLSALSSDPNDLAALTPGHFLVGGPLVATPEPSILDIGINRLKRWKQVQQMHQDFWKRWHCEYLRELNVRNKWQQASTNVKIDDLVLLRDERTPPTQWPMGRIISVHPGDDNLIRVATIRTASSVIKRALSKIIVLPIQQDQEPHGGWP